MNLWQTKGSGKHQTFLQKAIEGAVVNALGLSEYGSSKAKGKEDASKPANTAAFCCQWDTCKAAIKMQTTRGNTGVCHGCGRTRDKALNPPLERCQEWAFAQKVEAKHKPAAGATDSSKGAGKGSSKGKGKDGRQNPKGNGKSFSKGSDSPPADTSTEQLKALRAQRIESMKSGVLPMEPTAKPTISEEIGKTFTVEKDTGAAKVVVDEQLVDSATVLSTHAKEVIDCLQAEHFPSTKVLLGAEGTLSKLLLSVASCASVEAMDAAEASLAATVRSLANMIDLPKDDPDVVVWQKRKVRQEKEVARLGNRAPTLSLQKLALIGAKDTYVTSLQADADFAAKGREKATKRAQHRRCNLESMAGLIADLQKVHEEQTASLLDLHDARAAKKALLGDEVQDLITEKITALDNQMLVDTESDVEWCEAAEHPTSTEIELEEWKAKCREGVSNSSEALNAAVAERMVKAEAETAAAKATATAAVAAKDLMEARLAKLEERFLAAPAIPAATPTGLPDAASGSDPRSDLWLLFEANQTDLPNRGTLTGQEKQALDQVSALFAAVPWGSSLPALQFDDIGVPPSLVHALVGDVIWSKCWLHRKNDINGQHWIPNQLLNILMAAVLPDTQHLDASQLAAGVKRYAEFNGLAESSAVAKRRHMPY